MNIIVRDFGRPDPNTVKGFEGIPTGVVSDAMGRCNSMAAEIKPVWPGDIILGDADGVIVVALEEAEDVLAKSQAAAAKEQQIRQRIKQGEYIYEMLKLGEVLKSLGVVEK